MHFKKNHLSDLGKLKNLFLVVFLVYSSTIYAQSAINLLDLYHESFSEKTARILTTNASIGDYSYHANVGGISFEAVASPAEQLKNKSITLDFIDNRLTIQIESETFRPNLPVWQLIPIVNFVDSPYSVVFSQLGDTIGNRGAECRFHPAFLDNMLGLRLFQADLLNLTDILWDLPMDAQRRYILAPSEQPFVPAKDTTLHRIIYNKLIDRSYTSYVLTDKNVNFIFNADESGFNISGLPYYYFTRTELDMENIQKIKNQLIDCYSEVETQAKILLKEDYTPALNPRTNMGELLKVLNKHKDEKIFNPYSMNYMIKALNTIDSLNNMTNDQIGIKFQVLNDYSESFKSYWISLKKYNPLVYSVVENAAQWSAFFRYVRKTNPGNWTLFVKKIHAEAVSDAPTVQTPTSFEINYFRYFDEKEKSNR